jgi:hypothetical protein
VRAPLDPIASGVLVQTQQGDLYALGL